MDVLILSASSGHGGETMMGLFIVLAVAGVTALAMGRAGVAAIPAFLIAGAIAGPHALGLVGSAEHLGTISELAIIMLLFGIGLHIDPGELGKGSTRLIIAGVLSIVTCVALIWPLTFLFGLDWAGGLAVSLALSVSSTAVVLRRLMQRRELKRPAGRLSLTVLIVQDLAVPILLIAISALGSLRAETGEADAESTSTFVVLGLALLSIAGAALLVIVGRWFLPRLLRQATMVGSDEVMLTLGVAVAIGSALITAKIGFTYELGAFLSGLILGGTPFRHQVSALMGPARDLFLAVFFTTLGMAVDPSALAENWIAVLIAGTVMVFIKSLAIGAAVWITWGTAALAGTVGVTLCQAGEFSLILLDASSDAGLIDEATKTATVAIVVISLIMTPVPIMLGRWMTPWLERLPMPPWRRVPLPVPGAISPEDEDGSKVRVIVGGYGPIGRVATDLLEKHGASTTIVELNEKTVRTHTAMGRSMVYGDLSKPDVLESAGIREVQALILTTPDEAANLQACAFARSANPGLCIVVRTTNLGSGLRAKSIGADAIVVEEVAAAQAMEKVVAERFAGLLETEDDSPEETDITDADETAPEKPA